MAIRVNSERGKYKNDDGVDEMQFFIANGDLAALEAIQNEYHVRSPEDVIAFAIGVLKTANGGPIAVFNKETGVMRRFLPSDEVRKDATAK